jgi:sugar lactone lactonase YvrE
VFIADQGCGRIFEIVKSSGNIVTIAGGGANDVDNPPIQATTARLRSPHNVAVDGSGNLYIAESSGHKIRKVNIATGMISTVAGNGFGMGTQWGGYTGDGGPAISAELNWPTDVKLDSAGNLYIADMWNNAIRKVTAATGKISTAAGNGFGALSAQITSSACGYSGDGGLSANAELCAPSGVTVDNAGNLYISDRGNNVLRKVTVSSVPPTATTAAPTFTVSAGAYPAPQLVSITDNTKGASIHFTVDGTTPTSASPGYKGPINVSGTVTIKAIANAPGYLQSAPVTATYTITSLPAAVITTVAGTGVAGFSRNGGAALNASLGYLDDVAVDVGGNLYLADSTNNVIWKVWASSGAIAIVAGNGYGGYWGDGGIATQAALNDPASVAVDNVGNLYIADANNNLIRKVAAGTGIITTVAGTFEGNGKCNWGGDDGPATSAELCYPASVRLDSAGNIYIADEGNYVVRKVDKTTGVISPVAGYGANGDGGLATDASLSGPNALAFDKSDNLYIADSSARIRKVTKTTGIITTVVGNGDAGNSGDGGPAKSAEITPWGMAIDPSGNLFIADGWNSVREVFSATGIISTAAGNGFCGSWGDGGSATIAELCAPSAVAFGPGGSFYIADSSNYKVRKVGPPPTGKAARASFR